MIHAAEIYWIDCDLCRARMNGTWGSIDKAEQFATLASWTIDGHSHYCPTCSEKRLEEAGKKLAEAVWGK